MSSSALGGTLDLPTFQEFANCAANLWGLVLCWLIKCCRCYNDRFIPLLKHVFLLPHDESYFHSVSIVAYFFGFHSVSIVAYLVRFGVKF